MSYPICGQVLSLKRNNFYDFAFASLEDNTLLEGINFGFSLFAEKSPGGSVG